MGDTSAVKMVRAVACLTHPENVARVRSAASFDLSIVIFHDATSTEAYALRKKASIAIAEIVDAHNRTLASALARGWKETLGIPVIALVRLTSKDTRLIAETVRAGAADVVLIGVDDLGLAVKSMCARAALWQPIRAAVVASVPSEAAQLAVETCVQLGQSRANASRVAAVFGCSARSLARQFEKLGLPHPGVVLRWVRVIAAIEDLRRGATVASVASAHGYSCAASLRRSMRELLGMTPRTAAEPRSRHIALARFEEVLGRQWDGQSRPRRVATLP